MDKVYKSPRCSTELKERGSLQLTQTIRNFLLMEPEILDNLDVQCWKRGSVTSASDLVRKQGKP